MSLHFVLERLKADGICLNNSHKMPPIMTKRTDLSRVKFVPDGNGRWCLHPKEIVENDQNVQSVTREAVLGSQVALLMPAIPR